MPIRSDPISGCRYQYSTRRDAVITLTNRFRLANAGNFTLTVRLPRRLFKTWFAESSKFSRSNIILRGIVRALHDTRDGLYGRKKTISAPLFAQLFDFPNQEWKLTRNGVAYPVNHLELMKWNASRSGLQNLWQARIQISRGEIPLIQKWISAENLLSKAIAIELLFFSSPILDSILRPSRGRIAKSRGLSMHLPWAYFASRHLVTIADKDRAVDERIECLLQALAKIDSGVAERQREAKNLPDSYQDQLAIVLLVYRAFYQAWEKYKIDGLPEPQEAFRRYLYGKKRSAMTALSSINKYDESLLQVLLISWKKLFLGDIGAAAKAFRLI